MPRFHIPTAAPGMDSLLISETIFCDTFLKLGSLMFEVDKFIDSPLIFNQDLQQLLVCSMQLLGE